MPLAQPDNLLTLDAGLTHFRAVYMPARNYSKRTREEYESDLSDLISFLTTRNLTAWPVVGLRDLQSYMADLDRRGLAPAFRNRKSYTIGAGFAAVTRSDTCAGMLPPTPYCRQSPHDG